MANAEVPAEGEANTGTADALSPKDQQYLDEQLTRAAREVAREFVQGVSRLSVHLDDVLVLRTRRTLLPEFLKMIRDELREWTGWRGLLIVLPEEADLTKLELDPQLEEDLAHLLPLRVAARKKREAEGKG